MRTHRLPPVDTSGYISCPIDTPLIDFDKQSPLPCIIVTPSESATEYHIAFHHKSSPLAHKNSIFLTQQQQAQPRPRARRAFLTAINPFESPTASDSPFEAIPRRIPSFKPRTALVLAIPIFIIVCHILASSLLRSVGFAGTIFGASIARGGFSSAAAHMRAQRDQVAPSERLPAPTPALQAEPQDQPAASQPPPNSTLD
ncbi:hypothetical protein K439DRAFT_1656171 [Ramaria rubella]|nr:hypothetical protein K439DRAFT_1656171 [Ramaria rubella]